MQKTPKSAGQQMTDTVRELAPYLNLSHLARETGVSISTIRRRMEDGTPFSLLQTVSLRQYFGKVKDVLKANGLGW